MGDSSLAYAAGYHVAQFRSFNGPALQAKTIPVKTVTQHFARNALIAACVVASLVAGTAARCAAVDPLVLEAEQERVSVIERVSAPTVAIFDAKGTGGGSGVLIREDGLAVTNFHVVGGLGPFMKCGLNDGNVYDAVIIGIDPTGDVALIQLLGRDDFPAAKIGDSDALRIGGWVYVVGNPFLLATDFTPTVTYGIISGVHRYQFPAGTILEYTDCIQVDASINPGNSGGPLFNADGELVGINGRASFEKRGSVNIGAGYAISINQIMNFLDHLQSGRIVDHATLGATVQSQSDGSVVVDGILEQSEAYRRGLRAGDELVSFAGRSIRSVNQFKNILGIYPKGWMRPLVYRREGEKHEIMVRLRALHRRAELLSTKNAMQPQQPPGGPQPPDGPPHRPGGPLPEHGPLIPHLKQPEPEIPEAYADLYEQREGFANYRVNKLHRDRVMDGIRRLGDFPAGPWKITGGTLAGDAVAFQMNDTAVALTQAGQPFFQDVDEPLFADAPPGTGGLLAAMHHLRQMLIAPEERFTELYYLGSEPLDGDGERVDVLVATRGSTTSRWYLRKSDHTLLGFDTEVEPDADPCEIRIDEWREFDGRQFPGRFTLRHATEDVAVYDIQQLQFGDSQE